MNFSIGSDPEFFLKTKAGEYRSAIKILPKKENAIVEKSNHFFYDNVVAEIAIKPAKTKEQFLKNTQIALRTLSRLIHPLRLEVKAAVNFPVDELDDKDAKKVNCNCQMDAYTLKTIKRPKSVFANTPFRVAGGHIHVGSSVIHSDAKKIIMARMMDLFLGIPSLFLDKDPASKARRRVYGSAGSHRNPSYGIEYTSLGNFWLSSPQFVSLIYDLTAFCLEFVANNGHEKFWSFKEDVDPSKAHHCFGYDVNLLRKCINTFDKKQADKFMTFVSNYLPQKIWNQIETLSMISKIDPYAEWDIPYEL